MSLSAPRYQLSLVQIDCRDLYVYRQRLVEAIQELAGADQHLKEAIQLLLRYVDSKFTYV